MGSGKTTLGKRLANKLNKIFFDLDAEIEKNEGEPINEIFEKHGENYFRKIEKEILHKIINNNENFVMSLGGGTPCFYDNMNVVNHSGVSIYIKYNSGILASRLMNAKTERPLIKNFTNLELKKYVENKLTEREGFYSESEIILEQNNLKIEDIIKLI